MIMDFLLSRVRISGTEVKNLFREPKAVSAWLFHFIFLGDPFRRNVMGKAMVKTKTSDKHSVIVYKNNQESLDFLD